jgi:MtN3 and saliva related transmembrane protein
MLLIDIIGFCAATLTTAAFVPQAMHTYQTKDASGISLGMYSGFALGVALWLVYGLLLGAWPILAITILVMKLRYHEK